MGRREVHEGQKAEGRGNLGAGTQGWLGFLVGIAI